MYEFRWGRVIAVILLLFFLSSFMRCGTGYYGGHGGYGYGGGGFLGTALGFMGGYGLGRMSSGGNRQRGFTNRSSRRGSFGGFGRRGGGFGFGK